PDKGPWIISTCFFSRERISIIYLQKLGAKLRNCNKKQDIHQSHFAKIANSAIRFRQVAECIRTMQ
ncbi:hypothetical protein, partial [Duncaniella dubosii]|uniref:hypothetical protein n=1 Tax=Duncaniella dubosii TaxID=2518971 RepID=UPI0032B110AB